MRAVTQQIVGAGGDLVLVGNGDPQQAREFLATTRFPDDSKRLRLLVDPDLSGYRAANLKRRLLAPYSPIGFLKGALLALRGVRFGRVQGDNFQLGGVFLITPDQSVEFAHINDSVYDPAPIWKVLEVLRRLGPSNAA